MGSVVPGKWLALDSFPFFAHFLWNHAIIMGMAGLNSIAIIAITIAHMEIRRALREQVVYTTQLGLSAK
jgi:hypothetical protein